MDIHTSTSADIHESQPPQDKRPWRESETWRSLQEVGPWLWRIGMLVGTAWIIYIGFHDANAEQTVAIREIREKQTSMQSQIDAKGAARDRQIDKLVTDDKFEERTNAIAGRLDRIEQQQNEILNRLPVKNY